jgi:hypothetical protein
MCTVQPSVLTIVPQLFRLIFEIVMIILPLHLLISYGNRHGTADDVVIYLIPILLCNKKNTLLLVGKVYIIIETFFLLL